MQLFSKTKVLILVLISILSIDVYACTSAIFTGKCTKDGRPLMWKNRDTGELNNRMQYFKGKRYCFTGLVNSPSKEGEVWAGSNEAGFCIMNTASYNLAIAAEKDYQDAEGVVMYKALGVCRTLKDFENFLDTIKKPLAVEANFGVIDAEGGAAYYEVNTRTWKKYDANDTSIAPDGYLIWTNYSRSGRKDEGLGYIRWQSATDIVEQAYREGVKFSAEWVAENLSRSFYHSVLKTDLRTSNLTDKTDGWFMDQDFISRKSTSAVSIFQGVKKGEDVRNTIFWSGIGYGPLAIIVPIFMIDPEIMPYSLLKGSSTTNKNNSIVCDYVLELKKHIFPITRGSGNKYLYFVKLYNSEGNGFAQQLAPFQKQVFEKATPVIELLRQGKLDSKDIRSFTEDINNLLISAYKSLTQ